MNNFRLKFFLEHVEKHGVSSTARLIGCNKSTISQISKNKYPGKSKKYVDLLWTKAGDETIVECPVLGEISGLGCREKQEWVKTLSQPATGNRSSIQLYKQCPTCTKGV